MNGSTQNRHTDTERISGFKGVISGDILRVLRAKGISDESANIDTQLPDSETYEQAHGYITSSFEPITHINLMQENPIYIHFSGHNLQWRAMDEVDEWSAKLTSYFDPESLIKYFVAAKKVLDIWQEYRSKLSRVASPYSPVTIQNPEEIEVFLDQFPNVRPVMEEAQDKILDFFEEEEMGITLEHDPESPDDYQYLVFTLTTGYTPEKALDLLYQFYDIWWFEALKRADNRIVLTFEYK